MNGFLEDLNSLTPYVNDPLAWIHGQFIRHVLKLNNETLNYVIDNLKKNLKKPYLG